MINSREAMRTALHDRARIVHGPRWKRLLWKPWRRLRHESLSLMAGMREGPQYVSARTFWGQRMTVVLEEPVSEQILRNGYFEEGLSQILIEWLQPGMTFFDVGAHFGYHSLLAAHLVGPQGTVCAFEPMPESHRILQRNTLGAGNINRIAAAVFSRSGTLAMTDHGISSSAFASFTQPRASVSSREQVQREVRATTLDDFVAASGLVPHVVKIDVESAEAHVLDGMQTVIERHRPAISLEVGDIDIPNIPRSRELIDRLIGLGYRVFEYGSPLEPLRPHTPREAYVYDNLFFAPE